MFSLQHYSCHLAHTADTAHHTYRRRQELPIFVTDNFHVSTNKLNASLYYLPVMHLHPKQHDIFIFSRVRITWREFPVIKARKSFCIVNSLNTRRIQLWLTILNDSYCDTATRCRGLGMNLLSPQGDAIYLSYPAIYSILLQPFYS